MPFPFPDQYPQLFIRIPGAFRKQNIDRTSRFRTYSPVAVIFFFSRNIFSLIHTTNKGLDPPSRGGGEKANRDSSGHWNRTRFHHDQAETAGACCLLGVDGCAVEDEPLVTKIHWKINPISSILRWHRILVGKKKNWTPHLLRF